MREDMKSMIADTFSQMLEKEDIDKITVTKLIGECHISRQTFYYHFRDIMDVLDWTFRRSTQALARRSLEAEDRRSLEAEDRVGALTAYVIFVRQNRIKLEKLLYSRRWVQIEAMLTESVMIYLAELARGQGKDIRVSVDDMEVMLRFYASGMVGVLLQYVGKPHLDEEKLVIQMEKIITGKMFPGEQS